MRYGWSFPANNGGEETGLNDAGIETFRAKGSLARETLQNSLDAASGGAGARISVKIARIEVPRSELPGLDELEETIKKCRDTMLTDCTTISQRIENGQLEFERALQLINQRTIPVLKIADYYTTGLAGDDETRMSPWYRLIRQQGTSSLHGAAGGTFGIGQRAPFAFSGLRTVFYNTRTKHGTACIGKAIWSTFFDGSTMRRHVGYWGQLDETDRASAFLDPSSISPLFSRSEVGLDLLVLGFDNLSWRQQLARETMINFYIALADGRLELELEEVNTKPLLLNAETIEYRLNEQIMRAETKAEREPLEMARAHLQAYRQPIGGGPFLGRTPSLGEVKLYVRLGEGSSNRVAYMRTPRILVHTRQVSGLRGYTAVFICEDEIGNRALAKLEDPTHTRWDREKPRGSTILGEVNAFVRAALEGALRGQEAEREDIPDLNKYLPESDDDLVGGPPAQALQVGDGPTTEIESARHRHEAGARIILKRATPRAAIEGVKDNSGSEVNEEDGATGGAFGNGPGSRGIGPGGGPGAMDGKGPREGTLVRGPRPYPVKFRGFFESSTGFHRLLFRGDATEEIFVQVRAVGEDGGELLEIREAKDNRTGASVLENDSRLRIAFANGNADIRIKLGQQRRYLLAAEVFDA